MNNIHNFSFEFFDIFFSFRQGDGESIPEEQPDEFGGSSAAAAAAAAAAAPASVVQGKTKSDAGGRSGGGWRRWAVPLALLAAAAATRFHDLDTPRNIVFDELHYGRYAGLYLKRTFFFDSHPPLGKQLLAAAGYLAGFQGTPTAFPRKTVTRTTVYERSLANSHSYDCLLGKPRKQSLL